MLNLSDVKQLARSSQLLDKLLATQYKLQDKFGTWDKIRDDPAARQNFLNQIFLALTEETVEIMRETAYKNPEFVPFGWKKGQKFNDEGFKSEIIDQLHFWLVLALVAGFRDGHEIYEAYLRKNNINHERQANGY